MIYFAVRTPLFSYKRIKLFKYLKNMKKLIVLLGILACFVSCKCTNEAPKENLNEPAVELPDSLGYVERTIVLDRQAMFAKGVDDDYRWYETNIRLVNFLDDEYDGIEEVVNVFQTVESRDEHSFDTVVYKFQHTADGTIEGFTHGFWVEDYPLNNEQIIVTFTQALEKVNEVNLPKPHSRYVVLRKEVGPVDANPQWIFGNSRAQLYVDAVTGEVSEENPAFKGLNLGTPLGEWP